VSISTTSRRFASYTDALLLIGVGAIAGFVNGLLGTGGGILLVLIFSHCAKRAVNSHSISFPMARRDIYANALAVMLPISVFSATRYAAAGALDMTSFAPMILPSLLGGVLGGFLLDRLHLSFLRKLFSLLVLISGVLMIVRG
jgi:uncharacterized membrane protein YfcA